MTLQFNTLEDFDYNGKTVLVRCDLNVPMQGGKVTDNTRIVRALPTLEYLIKKKARIVLLSHFGRPKGKFVPDMSLSPIVDALSQAMGGKEIKFSATVTGPEVSEAVEKLKAGDILLLENLRFHPEEEKGDSGFAKALAALGDVFVNDAFSASHRAHASITGIADYLPAVAGKLMEQEVGMITGILGDAKKPIVALVGGAKVSTKIDLLENLVKTMDAIMIGGAMANTFFYAQGLKVGKSLVETDAKKTALSILKAAEKNHCRLLLPVDVVAASEFAAHAECKIVDVDHIPASGMAIDIGPRTVELFVEEIRRAETLVWNGPMGAFETSPFDVSTVTLARTIAYQTAKKKLKSIAGGGDTVAALTHAGLAHELTYLSTAGGAFLEWLEGKKLPGVAALMK